MLPARTFPVSTKSHLNKANAMINVTAATIERDGKILLAKRSSTSTLNVIGLDVPIWLVGVREYGNDLKSAITDKIVIIIDRFTKHVELSEFLQENLLTLRSRRYGYEISLLHFYINDNDIIYTIGIFRYTLR